MNKLKNRSLSIFSIGIILLLTSQITIGFGQVDFQSYQTVDKPSDIIWIEGGFVVATGESGIRLYHINPRTMEVTLWAPTFKGGDEVHMSTTLGPSFSSGTVFANRDDTIFSISPDGQSVRNLVTPSPGYNIAGLTNDYEKYWNYDILAVTYDGKVWKIDSNGNTELIAQLGNNAIPNGITVAPADFGDFSGDILISLKNENKIIAIDHIDHSISDLYEFQGETPGEMKHNLRISTFYASNQVENKIHSLSQEITSPFITQLSVITENEQDNSLSIKSIRSTRLGVEVSEIASGISNQDISGSIYVGDNDYARALEVPPEEVVEIDPRLIIFPILAIVVIGLVVIIWRYRGF